MNAVSSLSIVIALLSLLLASLSLTFHRAEKRLNEKINDLYHDHVAPSRNEKQKLQQERTRYLTVKGAVGDGVTDDTRAIQRAINRAANNRKGGVVDLQKGTFLTTKPLILKGGVTLRGQGYGSSPLNIKFNAGGSVIAYCGDDYAVKMNGHAAGLENLAVYDWRYPEGSACDNIKAAGGVLVTADNRLVESIKMRDVLLIYFMGGTSLTLEAKNSGGIGYSSFENVRIRYAKVGIHLSAVDEASFVNSNSFYSGAISGEMTDLGVLATGPGACNDNKFQGMVIEPPATSIAHVYVSGSKTNVRMHDVRLEGTEMTQDKPLIIIDDSSYANVMDGLLGHTNVQADFNRNPGITFATNKMVSLQPPLDNLFWNAAFTGLDADATPPTLPGWALSGTNFQISSSDEELLYPGHNILQITYIDNGSTFKFKPSSIPGSTLHSYCTFGVYAQASTNSSISAAMKSQSGSTIASSSHSGSGEWEFIGMSSLFDKTNGANAYFSITGNVNITAPTFTYGHNQAMPGTEILSSSGGRMAGLLSMNMIDVSAPVEGGIWTLPKEGNMFSVQAFPETGTPPCDTSYVTITRINDSSAQRFPRGTVITLLFPACGGCVKCLSIRHDGAYITLMGGASFSPPPESPNSSLTLISKGSSWVEVSRNAV